MFTSCPSFIDRYFTRQYFVDVMNKQDEDICLLAHSNGVCVLTLASWHPIVRGIGNGVMKSVDYKVTERLDRMNNKVSGKSKRGAQFLAPDSAICRIFYGENGENVFTVRACKKGRLVEVNERLINEPQLLVTHPDTLGYIAVMIQKRESQQDEKNGDNAEEKSTKWVSGSNVFQAIRRSAYLQLRYPGTADVLDPVSMVTRDNDDDSGE